MKSHPFLRGKWFLFLCIVPVALAACGGGGGGSSKPQASAAKSTITAAPTTVTADGKAVANIAVTLNDTKGNPYTGAADVTIKADSCTNCTLSYVNNNGMVTGTQGIANASGNVLRAYVALAQGPNDPCSPTVWALYDPATLAPVYTPDFGAGACANRARLIYGPNQGVLTGNVPDSAGGGTSVFSLYGLLTDSPVLKRLGHYALPAGAASIEVVPIF